MSQFTDKKTPPSQLSEAELKFLLTLINSSSFKGGDVELLYNLVLKLQNQYLYLNKQSK